MALRTALPFAATASLVLGTIFASNLAERRIPESLAAPLSGINSNIEGWSLATDNPLSAPTLNALKPTAYLARTYRKGSSQLDLFIAYYAEQRAGESMHSPKHCLPGSGWEIWDHGSALLPFKGKNVEVNRYRIENGGTRMLMIYWYQSKDRIVASEYLAKLLLARDTILTGHTAGSIVRVIVPDVPGLPADGLQFASAVIPQVQRCLGR